MRKWVTRLGSGVLLPVIVGLVVSWVNKVSFWQGIWSVLVWVWGVLWIRAPIPLWALALVAYILVRAGLKWLGRVLSLPEESRVRVHTEIAESQLEKLEWRVLHVLVGKDGKAATPREFEQHLRCGWLLISASIDKLMRLKLIDDDQDSWGGTCFVLTTFGRDFLIKKGIIQAGGPSP